MIQYLYLGRVAYDEALRLQQELVVLRYEGRIGNTLLLLEHPPVLTLGRNADRSNVLASDELLGSRGVTLHQINRGGDVTYHGPGQLVGYPIFDLRSLRGSIGGRLGPVDFVRLIEEALIRLCATFGVRAGRIPGLTGVWCGVAPLGDAPEGVDPQGNGLEMEGGGGFNPRTTSTELRWALAPEGRPSPALPQDPNLPATSPAPTETLPSRKIGAIGIHVSRGITSHGFAFNVTTNLADFRLINPCGITDKPVTSLEREIAEPALLQSLESIAHHTARHFGQVFDQQILAVESLKALRSKAWAATAPQPEFPAPKFPANDTPLAIPPEVERLHTRKDRLTQA